MVDMFAAMKDSVVEFVIFDGLTSSYPDWFHSEVLDHSYLDEDCYVIYPKAFATADNMDDCADMLIEDYDVFVRNGRRDIRKISIDLFNDYYQDLGLGHAAPKSDMIEFFIFKTDGSQQGRIPGWIREMVREGIVTSIHGCVMFYDARGEIAMSPTCVFLRNNAGDVIYLETYKFSEFFFTPYFSDLE